MLYYSNDQRTAHDNIVSLQYLFESSTLLVLFRLIALLAINICQRTTKNRTCFKSSILHFLI